MYNWDRENCPLYGVAECLLFRGCLSIEVNGRAVGTFRIVRYIVGVRYSRVSVKRGSTVFVDYKYTCIVTEVLSTLHPGATGLCFIVKGLLGDIDR